MSFFVTFPDGTRAEFERAAAASEALSGRVRPADLVACKIDGRVSDLARRIDSDCSLEPVLKGSAEALDVLRHSVSHVMAGVVLGMFPGGKTAIGPAIQTGFYYDFDLPRPLTEDDLAEIERRMAEVLRTSASFRREELAPAKAREMFRDQPFKIELIDDILKDDPKAAISIYTHDGFTDLCAGPHVASTSVIPAEGIKILSIAGAYWRGDERRQMLQRVYGTAFFSADDLKAHLDRLAEIERRDHRKLGKELDLFSIHQDLGPGLVLWHPAGAVIRREIERFWVDEHVRRGYETVYSPHIASERIYERSGHLEAYSDMMYAPMDIDGQKYRAKPMNCPGHITIFQNRRRSYRELPMRLAELGTVYRYERSGVLHGMLRVRGFTQDDAHIFCSRAQLRQEIYGVLDLFDAMMKVFGYSCKVYLATRPEKYIGTDEEWDFATGTLRKALEDRGSAFEVDEGGGVFYAPKIDLKMLDALGREWQGPTCQVDLNLPVRFDLNFVNAEGRDERAVMVHRTVLGSMERFVGGLIEHYAGAFPLWISPVQAVIVPVTKRQLAYAGEAASAMKAKGLRVKVDDRSEKVGFKIRELTIQKVPYVFVAGEREEKAGTLSVRTYHRGDEGAAPIGDCVSRLAAEVESKSLPQSS